MPRRDDIETVLIVGSGPIVIGQACEFDYSGTQGCRALRAAGFRVVLVNSNPATIMTDPDVADATYVEPLTPGSVLRVIERERPDALLPTLGGQTALNLAVRLAERGALEANGVRLIGADLEAIRRAEDRRRFAETAAAAGLAMPPSGVAASVEEALAIAAGVGYPVIVRPSFVLGGGGAGIAPDPEALRDAAARGLAASPVGEVLVEGSVAGWKEFELEVMRDGADNAVVVCSIENLDPMGVHTGDSITVAPAQTLSDREYQAMRDAALACIRAVGVETGGANVQFAVDPTDGRMVLIEMNPRVSRSSALASKATGFPIAKVASLLAVGFTLDEIPNDITGETLAAFEPALDYVVVKVPRFSFEKFPGAEQMLGTTMRSVGEVMAVGRTFGEALGKALRSLETPPAEPAGAAIDAVGTPTDRRILQVAEALRGGADVDDVAAASAIDPWFVDRVVEVVEAEERLRGWPLWSLDPAEIRSAKRAGVSDQRIAALTGSTAAGVRAFRRAAGVRAVFKSVDTCAGEFEARTPYHYSSFEDETEVRMGNRPRVVVLGAGPNRIGQGIEFDHACVHAALALKEAGYEAVMVNSNPETVSTDHETADRLYVEPLAEEDVLAVCEAERPEGVIVQFGGQTPLSLARTLERAGFTVLGTPAEAIDLAEDRGRFAALLAGLGIPIPAHGEARTLGEAVAVAAGIGYPVVVRPSYVLGGRAMEVVYAPEDLERFVTSATAASPEHPVFIDRFLEGAVEVDVDAVCDGEDVVIGAVMEHIEEAGVHSGDSACVLPPPTLSDEELDLIESHVGRIARALGVRGVVNVQLAVKDDTAWVLEANPRASRTLPFVAKATGLSLARVATLLLAGRTLRGLAQEGLVPSPDAPAPYRSLRHTAVKAPVLPFDRFPGADPVLGPEMRSTGEVMGIDADPGLALAKALVAAGTGLPRRGTAFLSVANRDKRHVAFPAKRLADVGFKLVATKGTARALRRAGVPVWMVRKRSEGHPDVVDLIEAGRVDLVVNTPFGRRARSDGFHIRRAAADAGVPCVTTIQGLLAVVRAIEALRGPEGGPRSLQELHASMATPPAQPELPLHEPAAAPDLRDGVGAPVGGTVST